MLGGSDPATVPEGKKGSVGQMAYRSELSRGKRGRDARALVAPAIAPLINQRLLERVVNEVHRLEYGWVTVVRWVRRVLYLRVRRVRRVLCEFGGPNGCCR